VHVRRHLGAARGTGLGSSAAAGSRRFSADDVEGHCRDSLAGNQVVGQTYPVLQPSRPLGRGHPGRLERAAEHFVKQNIIPADAAQSFTDSMSILTRLARHLLLGQLRRIRYGRLRLIDVGQPPTIRARNMTKVLSTPGNRAGVTPIPIRDMADFMAQDGFHLGPRQVAMALGRPLHPMPNTCSMAKIYQTQYHEHGQVRHKEQENALH
jgi:hypothetical protein